MKSIMYELRKAGISSCEENAVLADYTTWKIGGPADLLIIPNSLEELKLTMHILDDHKVPWLQIGRGSNLLVSDKGVRGAVIKLGKAFEQIRFEEELVIAGGAYSFIRLSVMAGKQGLTGLEFAGGIPGSVGGAVYMNAGAHGSDVSRILQYAEVVLGNGELVRWEARDLDFRYRHSRLHEQPGIVTEAVFRLEYGDRKEIAAAMASYKDRRLRTQPLQLACAGSVFRNPPGDYAARLIEEAGLKGLRIGGAEVSTQHANFIINTGGASAMDVLTLMEKIQNEVYELSNIQLVPEVLMVGEP